MSKEEDLLQLLADANSIINRLKAQLEAKAAQFKGLRGCSTARINQLQAEINRLTEENNQLKELLLQTEPFINREGLRVLSRQIEQALKGEK